HPLAATHDGDNKQRKPTHDGRETTKRNQETILLNPLRNKESPRKRNQASQNADHDEAVTGQLVVGVDELESKKPDQPSPSQQHTTRRHTHITEPNRRHLRQRKRHHAISTLQPNPLQPARI